MSTIEIHPNLWNAYTHDGCTLLETSVNNVYRWQIGQGDGRDEE